MGYVIGIDPGLDGAVVVLSTALATEDSWFALLDTPTLTVAGKSGKRREYAASEMMRFLRGFTNVHALIENVHAMPGQGVRSMFSMGYGVGLWTGILAGLEIPFDRVSPQRWKKVLMDGMGHDKDAGRLRAQQVFPKHAELFARKKDDGRADAALIAEYGRRMRTSL